MIYTMNVPEEMLERMGFDKFEAETLNKEEKYKLMPRTSKGTANAPLN
jgi:hypothetical protein